ncbi:MAG: Na+/H+ antiporter NhaA [Verrucomicrobia bacterium]|nr:Na+/H+ antiporter NhaA [Verrucomicrobiota bacterium]
MVKKNRPTIFQRFFRTESASGSFLLLFGVAALALANSPFAEAYERLWQIRFAVGIAGRSLSLTLHQWINDGLMVVFFLLVGLEIKRELLVGELASVRKSALPIACAVGGMIVPASIFLICNAGGLGARGWGIPVATDIAFALGALALIAPDAPVGARIFLAALAIVDDMGAVLIIAIFYSHTLAWTALVAAALTLAVLIGLNALRVRQLWPYLLTGIVLWYFVHESGVHATVAGVAIAFAIPVHRRVNATDLPYKTLHNFSAFVVMPLFAFANAGVRIGGPLEHAEITAGVLLGLVIGKPMGITLAAFATVKSGIAQLPRGVNWGFLLGCACLAGIGFTMSLFITMLAFDEAAQINAAKSGILAGSLLAGITGAIVLKTVERSGADMDTHQH